MENKFCLIILLLTVTCTYSQAKMRVRGGATGSKLGESCEYDDDCDVTYSFCRAQQTCECKRGFEPGPTRDRCMATVGAVCTSSYDCAGLPNSECSQEVCACRNGYVPHPAMKECLQVANVYQGACVEHVQCTDGLNDRVECREGKCTCIPMHHYASGMCIASKGLDALCTKSEECHVSDTDASKNEQVECVAGRCQCIMGYHVATDGVTCTNGAAQLSTLSLLAVGLVYALARFLH